MKAISQMLGVARATVVDAAGERQQDGLIEYEDGRMHIRDRTGLELASCECYAIVRSEFDRLLDGRETPSPLDTLETSIAGKSTLSSGAGRRS